ncbi:glyoxalase [Allostella vacuolata]|nr:glyoxalase [Stella vacuolata]
MEQRLSLVTLGTRDLDRSRAFYERLGWVRSVRAAEGVAFFQMGGMVLALWTRAELAADAGVPAEGSGFAGVALSHNVRTPAEVETVLDQAVAAGATLLRPAVDREWGGRSGHFADPDGFVWEVAWNPGFPIAADGSIRLPD